MLLSLYHIVHWVVCRVSLTLFGEALLFMTLVTEWTALNNAGLIRKKKKICREHRFGEKIVGRERKRESKREKGEGKRTSDDN